MLYSTTRRSRSGLLRAVALLALLACLLPACGGGAGGEAAGRGLILVSFNQNAVAGVALNEVLEFRFSSNVDPATINASSIQIREGPAFGQSVAGDLIVSGSLVTFEPRLPTLCDLSDSGFKPGTAYRVQFIGYPEEFAVRNTAGQSLSTTSTSEFGTRAEDDPERYTDPVPGARPTILSRSPKNGDQAVAVAPGNRIEIVMSENIDPCSVNARRFASTCTRRATRMETTPLARRTRT